VLLRLLVGVDREGGVSDLVLWLKAEEVVACTRWKDGGRRGKCVREDIISIGVRRFCTFFLAIRSRSKRLDALNHIPDIEIGCG